MVELSAAYPTVPDPALRRARAAGLPVVVLNRKVRFVEVTEQVHRAIVAEQYDDLRFAGEVHQTFTELGLARAPMTRLVEAAADLVGASVVLEDLVPPGAGRGRPGGAGRPAAGRLGATVAADAVPPGQRERRSGALADHAGRHPGRCLGTAGRSRPVGEAGGPCRCSSARRRPSSSAG